MLVGWIGWILLLSLLFLALRNWLSSNQEIAQLKRSILLPTLLARIFKRFLPPLILFFILLALLGPKGNPHYSDEEIQKQEKKAPGNLLILIDTSSSMLATDTLSQETRFNAAKELAGGLVAASSQLNFVVYALGSELVKVVPRTLDKVFTRLLIKQMQINDGGEGTEFLPVFQTLEEEIKDIPKPLAIVLLTDGDDTSGGTLPLPSVPIFTAGFGTPEGAVVPQVSYQGKPVISHLNRALLSYLAENTHGKAFFLNEEEGREIIPSILQEIDRSSQTKILSNPKESLLWDEYFQIPLLMAALLLIVYLTWPDTYMRKGHLMIILAIPLSREVEIYFEAGSSQAMERVMETASPTSEWEKEAILFDRAVIKMASGEEGMDLLDSLNISSSSSPYVLEKLYQVLALAKIQSGGKMDLFQALYLLRDAEREACLLEKEKGYADCPLPYELDLLKKRVKSELSFPPSKGAYTLLSLVLEWIDRIHLVEAYPPYYDSFLREEVDPRLKDPFTQFKQKNFSKSLSLLEQEKEKLLVEASQTPLVLALQNVVIKDRLNKYDILALSDPALDGAVKKIEEGDRLGARLALLARLQELKRENYKTDSPLEVLQNTLDETRYALLLHSFSKKVPVTEILSALAPFIPSSEVWREKQFFEKGCETVSWNQVIPLYEKGKNSLILHELKKGYRALEEALKLLMHPHPQSQEALSETTRVFQDLELSDRPFQLQPPPEKVVEKPW